MPSFSGDGFNIGHFVGIPLWIPFTGNHGGVPLQIMSEIEIKPDCKDKVENRCLFDKIESAC